MNIDKRVTGALAWAGLALVIAIPSADLIASQLAPQKVGVVEPDAVAEVPKAEVPKAEVPKAEAPKADVAATTPPASKPVAVASTDAVGKFAATGKKLPSYISDAPEETVAAPGPTVTKPEATVTSIKPTPATAPTEVAALTPEPVVPVLVAPIPMPVSMRPAAPIMPPAAIGLEQVVTPEAVVPTYQTPPTAFADGFVDEDALAGWQSGTLTDYLAEQGGGSPPQAFTPGQIMEFDENGYLIVAD